MNSKIKAYVGFALKKGAVIFGFDNIVKSRRSRLVLMGADASDKTKQQVAFFCDQKHLPLLQGKTSFEEFFAQKNVKVFSLTDAELARAVLQNSDEDFISVEVV